MSFTYYYGALLFLLCVGFCAVRVLFCDVSRSKTLNTLGISSRRVDFIWNWAICGVRDWGW